VSDLEIALLMIIIGACMGAFAIMAYVQVTVGP
jgi:hypothetical protein